MNDVEYDRKTIDELKECFVTMLKQRYGYCGVASGTDNVFLNSGKTNIIIKIERKD